MCTPADHCSVLAIVVYEFLSFNERRRPLVSYQHIATKSAHILWRSCSPFHVRHEEDNCTNYRKRNVQLDFTFYRQSVL